jgi:hypothetical protein
MATLVGARTVAKNLKHLAAQVPIAAARALNSEAEETLSDALTLTPVDTGTLFRSGKISQYASAADLVATLTYGTNYALYVHEIPKPPQESAKGRSAEHAPPTQWKFLETAVNAHASKFSQNIAADIKKQLM